MAAEKKEEVPVVKSANSKVIFEKAKAGYPAIYLQTSEDVRSQREIQEATVALGRDLYIYTFGKGLTKHGGKTPQLVQNTEAPPEALDIIAKIGTPDKSTGLNSKVVVILRDFHEFLEDPLIKSKIKDILPDYKISKRMLIITAPIVKLPPELEKEFALVESALPDKKQIGELLDGIVEGTGLVGKDVPDLNRRKELIEAAMGLTTGEAENALSLSMVKPRIDKNPNIWDPSIVMSEKCQSLRKTGLLEFIPVASEGLKQVGGLDLLKEWVRRRKNCFTDKAKEFGLPAPKGILMVGPPGSGKSLSAKAISGELHMPLLRLDMGKMFGSLVGQSEANMRQAIQVAEAISPCILWIDEIEKGLAGSNAGALDSGVGARVLGTILTWMQEKTSPVFVYATSNDVTQLPPELLRKGRFDEMFSVTFPNMQEREEIFSIHLKKKKRYNLIENGKMDLDNLVNRSDGYSGAEIEACINEALFTAFDAGKDLDQLDIIDALDQTVPLSKTMKEKLAKLDEWCKVRTRPASRKEMTAGVGGRVIEAN